MGNMYRESSRANERKQEKELKRSISNQYERSLREYDIKIKGTLKTLSERDFLMFCNRLYNHSISKEVFGYVYLFYGIRKPDRILYIGCTTNEINTRFMNHPFIEKIIRDEIPELRHSRQTGFLGIPIDSNLITVSFRHGKTGEETCEYEVDFKKHLSHRIISSIENALIFKMKPKYNQKGRKGYSGYNLDIIFENEHWTRGTIIQPKIEKLEY
jgi:hypothetical protein